MADWTLATGAQEHLDEHNAFDHADLAFLTEGRVLGVLGGVFKQVDPLSKAKITSSSTYTVLSGDSVILLDTTNGAINVTLPDLAVMDLQSVLIKRVAGGNSVTISRSGSDLIDTGGSTATSRVLGSVGASWSGTAVDSKGRWYTVGVYGTVT